MAKTYLKTDQIVELWGLHKRGLNSQEIGEKLGISHNTASDWVRDIQAILNGVKVSRQKGLNDLKQAVKIIKAKGSNGAVKSMARQKLIDAIDEYVEEEVRERFSRLNKMLS